MISGIIIFSILLLAIKPLTDYLQNRHNYVNGVFLRYLFFYHYILWVAYYAYALSNPSDSVAYYNASISANNWMDEFGTSTTFIEFLNYPLVKYLGFSYEASMILFAFAGYLGFVFLYIFFTESLKFKHRILGFNLVHILFLLPNTHFWSVSIGKGSIIFLGIGLFFYGLSKLSSRYLVVVIGSILIYLVRPHVFFVVIVGGMLSILFSSSKVSFFQKVFLMAISLLIFINIYEDVLIMTGLDEDFFEESTTLAHRASELSKATSGIDIQSYSAPFQLFTFWFRPLFFDAPGVLGLIVSIENLAYIFIIFTLLGWSFPAFVIRGVPVIKTCLFTFLFVSYPLAQVSGNLGIAIRQKSMVMLLLFYVLLAYADSKKMNAYKNQLLSYWKRQKAGQALDAK